MKLQLAEPKFPWKGGIERLVPEEEETSGDY